MLSPPFQPPLSPFPTHSYVCRRYVSKVNRAMGPNSLKHALPVTNNQVR